MTGLDHVLVATPEPARVVTLLRDGFGLAAIRGGRHPDHGTANHIVPLGDGYVEVIHVDDPERASASPLGRWVLRGARTGVAIGGCIRPPDLDATCHRLGLVARSMNRITPEGVRLSWRLGGLEALDESGLPFFIEWDVPDRLHPAAQPAPHRDEVTGLGLVELHADPVVLGEWIGGDSDAVRAASGPGRFAVATARGGTLWIEGSDLA